MANDITALAPVLYSGVATVPNEVTGVISSINTDYDNKGVAQGDSVKVLVAPTRTTSTYTPSNIASAGTDATAESVSVSITNNEHVSWNLTGEQERSLENGENRGNWIGQLIQEGSRALRNSLESTAWTSCYQGASNAYGTAGTTPFASDIDILADMRKGMIDDGAPQVNWSCVMDTAASTNLLKQNLLTQANLQGTSAFREQGQLPNYYGFDLKESGQITTHTKGTGTGYLIDNGSGEAIGQTTLTLDTGSGTMIAGDVITHASDATNNYVVNTALAAGDVAIGKPGLKVAAADDDAVTIGNTYTANLGLYRGAAVAVVRPPLIPDNANFQMMPLNDPQTNITYLFIQIQQDGMITWRLHLAWGIKVINSQFVKILMG